MLFGKRRKVRDNLAQVTELYSPPRITRPVWPHLHVVKEDEDVETHHAWEWRERERNDDGA